ncbi:MAG: hypothetical protein IKK25_03880, partial [Lentisphaeria bacterium]|nr:hypothetical protein [Lentisphaeria bacterium]
MSAGLINGNDGAFAGWIYTKGSRSLTIKDTVIAENTVTLQRTVNCGVFISLNNSGQSTLDHLIFEKNKTTSSSSLTTDAICIKSTSAKITGGSKFIGNSILRSDGATNGSVALLSILADGVVVEDSLFQDNTAITTTVKTAVNNTFQNCEFIGNTGKNGGGAMSFTTGSATVFHTISDCLFEGNTGKNGGAIMSEGHLRLSDSAFIGNTTSGSGGAIYLTHSKGSYIANSTFYGNTAGGNGGAVYTIGSATVSYGSVTIAGNYAGGSGGGIYSNASGNAVLGVANSIILGNTSGGTKDTTTGVVTGAIDDDISVFQSGTADSADLRFGAGRSVIGTVTHLGYTDIVDGATVRNPLRDLEGNIIAQVRNVEYAADGDSASAAAVYRAGNVISNATYTIHDTFDDGGNLTGRGLISQIFGSAIKVNADGRTLRTYLVEGLTTGGVEVTVNAGQGNTDSRVGLAYQSGMTEGVDPKPVYVAIGIPSISNTATSNGYTTNGIQLAFTAENDQMGKSREFTILKDSIATTYYAKGASSGLLINPLVVETLDDTIDPYDYKTSLREAIEYANQEGGDQTITFSNNTDWLGTGTFGSGAKLTLNPALGAMNVTANITIDGALVYGNGIDQGTLAITGGDAVQIFTIAAGGGMTISNMSLTNGNAGEGNGGAINNAGTLALTNVNVSNSKAMNGGAIYSTGSLTVNGGTFYGNSVDGSDNLTGNGGAIHSTGTATISSAVFDSNSAKYNGGAIYNGGTLTIVGSVFSGHSAQNGVVFNQGNLLISGGTYTGNTANVLGIWGGTALIANAEIFGNTAADTIHINGDGSVIIIGSTIADNGTNVINAVSGSANVYNSILEGATAGTVNLYSSVYTSTTATADANSIPVTESAEAGSALKQIFGKEELSMSGGLLPVLDKALTGGIQFQVDGSDNLQYHNGTEWITIQANTLLTDAEAGQDITGANRRGAGLYTMGAYDASGLIVTTSADTVDPDDGKNSLREAIAFAVSLGGGTITFSKNVNWGTEGTTIKVTSTFNITAGMTGTLTIDGSLKYVDANGVETDYGRMTLDGGNTVTVAEDGKITFGKTGKRIFKVTTAGTFALNDLILQNAYVGSDGGAVVWQSGGSFNMDNCYLVHNTAIIGNQLGGAAVLFQNVKFHISNSKFEGNGFSSGTSNAAGGALFISGCTSADNTITNTDFLKNYADAAGNGKGGGAIAIRGASVVTITGGEFTENYAIRTSGGYGGEAGVIWLEGTNSKLVIDGATFSRNHADYFGGAIKMEGATILEVRNSTFTENYSVKSSGGAIAQPQGGTATITNSYFSKNEAIHGGAVYNNFGIITILNNVFTYNKATGVNGSGGAVRIGNANGNNPNEARTEDGAWIANSTFYGNSAAYGGAIANASSGTGNHPYFHNLTIVGNTATKKGGGFFAQHNATTSNTITNSIILGNTVGTDADDVCMVQNQTNNGNQKFTITNSVIGVFRHGGFGT